MPLRPKPTPPGKNAGPTPAELLAKMPRRPMTPEQQQAALEKVQQQATQRVKLGQQLFEAAEQRLKQHQQVLKEIQDQQQVLRDKVQEDVAKSLQTYDQWMGRIDESFTQAIKDLNGRLDLLESRFDGSRGEMEAMIGKAAALLEQTQGLLTEAFGEDALIGQEMQGSVAADSDLKLDGGEQEPHALDPIEADEGEGIDARRVGPTDAAGLPEMLPTAEEGENQATDIFGEVLRRLKPDGESDGYQASA